MTSLVVVASSVAVVGPAPVQAAGPEHRFLADDSASGSSKSVTAAVAAAGTGPTGFTDNQVWSGLTTPIAIRFASDGRIFVAEKTGRIKVFNDLNDQTPTIFADLSTNVDDYWDRGLLGMTLDPTSPPSPTCTSCMHFDAPIGGTAPVWNDGCRAPRARRPTAA